MRFQINNNFIKIKIKFIHFGHVAYFFGISVVPGPA